MTKRVKMVLHDHFEDVDYIENDAIVNHTASKDYDLIILNWALQHLTNSQAQQLLFNMRKALSMKRKNEWLNGAILIKEPYQQFDKEVKDQPFRSRYRLKKWV